MEAAYKDHSGPVEHFHMGGEKPMWLVFFLKINML